MQSMATTGLPRLRRTSITPRPTRPAAPVTATRETTAPYLLTTRPDQCGQLYMVEPAGLPWGVRRWCTSSRGNSSGPTASRTAANGAGVKR